MASKEQRDFAAALAERLQERARTLLAGDEAVLRLLRDAREQIMALLAAQPSDFAQWQLTRLRQQLDLVLQAAGQQSGAATGQLLQDLWRQGEDLIDKPLGAVGLGSVEMRLGALDVRLLSAMRAFALDRLSNVTTEAAARIGQQLGLVTLGAISPFDAIRRTQSILGESTPARASTIVLTEASRAFATASQQRLSQAAPLVPGLGKQWRRSGKLHSRWTHDLMDGQVVGPDEHFKVPSPNGGVDLMLGPHDPAAPAHQVINCFLPGTRIQGRVHSAFRMRYDGPVIELRTAQGLVLTVTPNHPVLAPTGWIAARLIKQGQHLLCYRPMVEKAARGAVAVEVGKDDPDARIEDVFGALAQAGTLRVVGAADDFHGDAVFGQKEIEVVGAACHLARDSQPGPDQLLRQRDLVAAGASEPVAPGAGARCAPLHRVSLAASRRIGADDLGLHGFGAAALDAVPHDAALLGLVANVGADLDQQAAHHVAGHTQLGAQLLDRHAGAVLAQQGVAARQLVTGAALCLGEAAHLDASLYQQAPDGVALDAQLAADLVSRYAGAVFADQVVAIREHEFSGHVYDVEACGGWIVADGICSSNCGCIALPHKREWQVMHPGAKPFTKRELARDPGKAQLDAQAKAAGLRLEPLAGADKAFIPPAKLAGYALNATHDKGGADKARVFASVLGYTAENADALAKQLLAGVQGQLATPALSDRHGQRWQVDIPVTGPAGSATVRTGWIVRPGSDSPQLTSAYIPDPPKKAKP